MPEPWPPVIVHFEILDFSRSPGQLQDNLYASPELEACRQSLLDNAFPITLAADAKLFVLPWQAPFVLDHVEESVICFDDGVQMTASDLKARHIVCSAEYREFINLAYDRLPSRLNVRVRRAAHIMLVL